METGQKTSKHTLAEFRNLSKNPINSTGNEFN